MKHFHLALALSIAISLSSAGRAQEKPAKWYKLAQGETYLSDFSLQPGESKVIPIRADRARSVSFQTDLLDQGTVDPKALRNYVQQQVIHLIASNGSYVYCSTRGTVVYPPHEEVLSLTAVNHSDRTFRIVIYSK